MYSMRLDRGILFLRRRGDALVAGREPAPAGVRGVLRRADRAAVRARRAKDGRMKTKVIAALCALLLALTLACDANVGDGSCRGPACYSSQGGNP